MTAIKQRNVTGFAPRSGHNEVKNSSHTSMAYNWLTRAQTKILNRTGN